MELHHHVPAARLTRRYFRRWWFGKGVSRAALERMQPVTELGIDLRTTPHVLGVPRYMFGSALRDVGAMAAAWIRRQPEVGFKHEMMLAYFAGYAWARWREASECAARGKSRAALPRRLSEPRTSSAPAGDPTA
jgi:hypothetical protein